MFESAELGHRLSKEVYAEIEPKLRTDLLDAVIINTGPNAYRRPDGIGVVPLALLGP